MEPLYPIKHWGELTGEVLGFDYDLLSEKNKKINALLRFRREENRRAKEARLKKKATVVPTPVKRAKLVEIALRPADSEYKKAEVKVNNPMVTQTIEVMQQTEMLQSLIDTYSTKSGASSYLCQMIPEVVFPPENAAELQTEEKLTKPIWFLPPQDTAFGRVRPRTYVKMNDEVCSASLRKAAAGQLRVVGFTDTAETALVLFTDSIQEFVFHFMDVLRDVRANDKSRYTSRELEVQMVEKAYFAMTGRSLIKIHNESQRSLVTRNRAEIQEFNEVLQEYDTMQVQQNANIKDEYQSGSYGDMYAEGMSVESNDSSQAMNSGSVIVMHPGSQKSDSESSQHYHFGTEGMHPYIQDNPADAYQRQE